MISIISVGFYSEDWEKILRNSVQKYTKVPYEILIWDNSKENLGHGRGLNNLLHLTKYPYILVLDIDCHIRRPNWDEECINLLTTDTKLKLLAGQGEPLKPIRPAVMFFERKFAIENFFDFSPRRFDDIKFDVGILNYFRVLSKGYKVLTLPEKATNYEGTIGTDYHLNNIPTFYHHWYGTRFKFDKIIDNKTEQEYLKNKDNLLIQIKDLL